MVLGHLTHCVGPGDTSQCVKGQTPDFPAGHYPNHTAGALVKLDGARMWKLIVGPAAQAAWYVRARHLCYQNVSESDKSRARGRRQTCTSLNPSGRLLRSAVVGPTWPRDGSGSNRPQTVPFFEGDFVLSPP